MHLARENVDIASAVARGGRNDAAVRAEEDVVKKDLVADRASTGCVHSGR